MAQEIATAIGLTLVAGLLGLPLALWLKHAAGDAPPYAYVALAPALGIAVTALVAAPAYMYIGPSEAWAWPMLMVLVGGAAFALGLLAGKPSFDKVKAGDLATLAAAIVVVCICFLTPAFVGGVNRTVFNTNPSDTFMYLTLAESTRTASWDQLRSYADAAPDLLRENPLALYSARFVGVIMRITTFADLGWYSEISGIGVERLLWPFSFAMAVATACGSWAVARLLGVRPVIASIAAVAITLGFWGAMPREADAYSNLQSTPLLMAMVALRISDAKGEKTSLLLAAAVGALIAAFAQVYTELAIFALGMLVAEAIARMILRHDFVGAPVSLGVALGTAAVILIGSGQFVYLLEITTNQFSNIASGAAGGSFVYENESRAGVVTAIAGFPWLPALLAKLQAPSLLGKVIALGLSVATILVAASVGILALLRRELPVLIVVVAAAGGVAMALLALQANDDVYIFQKAMTNAAPFSLLLLAFASTRATAQGRWKSALAMAATCLIVIQLAYPSIALARDAAGERPDYAERYHRGRNYDLSDLRTRLDEVCPCSLLVNVPPESDWWYAAYVSLSLSRYRPYYQMGVLYNNAPTTVILPALTPRSGLEYAVVAARDDYIGVQRLGRLMYDAGDLRLYQITVGESAPFQPRSPAQK